MVVGVGAPRGVVLGPVGGRMQGSKRWDVLAVGYPRANRDWGWGSMWVENGAVVGQRGHHGHDNDDDDGWPCTSVGASSGVDLGAVGQWAHHGHGNNIVVLHAHGMRLCARTVCL